MQWRCLDATYLRRLATHLAKEKKIPDFCDKILFYLHDEKTLHERGEAFEVNKSGRWLSISCQASIISTKALGLQLLQNLPCWLHQ